MGEFQIDWNEIKRDINNLLWVHLPPETTLSEADKLANELLASIRNNQSTKKG